MKKYLLLLPLIFASCIFASSQENPADCQEDPTYNENAGNPLCPACHMEIYQWRCPIGHGTDHRRDDDRDHGHGGDPGKDY